MRRGQFNSTGSQSGHFWMSQYAATLGSLLVLWPQTSKKSNVLRHILGRSWNIRLCSNDKRGGLEGNSWDNEGMVVAKLASLRLEAFVNHKAVMEPIHRLFLSKRACFTHSSLH